MAWVPVKRLSPCRVGPGAASLWHQAGTHDMNDCNTGYCQPVHTLNQTVVELRCTSLGCRLDWSMGFGPQRNPQLWERTMGCGCVGRTSWGNAGRDEKDSTFDQQEE